jgi:hypothetical protein
LSPNGKESGAKTDINSYNSSTQMKSSKSESSDEEEGNGKTGPNASSQNSKFTFFYSFYFSFWYSINYLFKEKYVNYGNQYLFLSLKQLIKL